MNERLNEVARTGTIDALYHLIGEDPSLLGRVDELQFVNTPLHIAAQEGNIHLVLEMMRLKPSMTRKLNQNGFSPIHLALQGNKDALVIRMINIDRELVRVQGKEYSTPLHCVAKEGNVKLMVEFLLACPESILDVNIRKESALHIAVLNDKVDTVKVMLEWLKLLDSEFVLGWTDEEGNTILHIAASTNNLQMIKMLIPMVDNYAKNYDGQTALDKIEPQTLNLIEKDKKLKIIHWLFRKRSHYNATLYCDTNNSSLVAESLKRGFPWYKRWILANHRHMSLVNKDGILVVAVLIATTAYQAIVALPTVFDNKLIAVASHYYFLVFQFFNTAAFVAAMSMIYILLPPGISYMLQLIIPIVVCYFVGIYLTNLQTELYMLSLILFIWQLVRFGRLDRNGRRERQFLLKHCASFRKESLCKLCLYLINNSTTNIIGRVGSKNFRTVSILATISHR
ncbi:PGG domain-containing protein [Heracleum sosnowskyi]|uniref:PGG domain-containing protein n=1 Tax=Heracleum sosnowskyi TaxID=360622 RepID=A0AAD8J1N5_9APIA|nr:PGG domain-containing protein [Heracleum sosnowskyi]